MQRVVFELFDHEDDGLCLWLFEIQVLTKNLSFLLKILLTVTLTKWVIRKPCHRKHRYKYTWITNTNTQIQSILFDRGDDAVAAEEAGGVRTLEDSHQITWVATLSKNTWLFCTLFCSFQPHPISWEGSLSRVSFTSHSPRLQLCSLGWERWDGWDQRRRLSMGGCCSWLPVPNFFSPMTSTPAAGHQEPHLLPHRPPTQGAPKCSVSTWRWACLSRAWSRPACWWWWLSLGATR